MKFESREEIITAGVYNPNGTNFAIGTNLGNIFLGSVKIDTQGKSKLAIGKLDNIQKQQVGITSLQFQKFDPIGSFLASFENGHIKTWQSSVKNEQFLKLMEIQN